MLELAQYRSLVALDDVRHIEPDPEWERSLRTVVADLGLAVPDDAPTPIVVRSLHGVLAPVGPRRLPDPLVDRLESIAAGMTAATGVVEPSQIPTLADDGFTAYPAAHAVALWVGDITRLAADVIVNAANSQLLGCRVPNHPCIDNAIHSAAGPRLRDDCATIVETQGTLEPVGVAKLTRGHALPARFVAHTVGPQLAPDAAPTDEERTLLASAYRSVLDVSAEVSAARTVAFCAISTGVFAFPKAPAARIALATIAQWSAANPGRFDRILIDCFSPSDAAIYREVLGAW